MLGTSTGASMTTTTSSSAMYRQRLQEKEDQVLRLQERVNSLSAQLQVALSNNASPSHPNRPTTSSSYMSRGKRRFHPLSPHATNVREVETSQNKRTITAQRERLGRTASISTRRVLENIPDSADGCPPPPIQRILEMFQRPSHHMDYLNSELFAKDFIKVTTKVRHLLEKEPRAVFLQSPAYVFGDIHGNLEDLHFFSDNIWRLGMSLTAGNFLFLGDYVDRGLHCLECVAYLFAMKLQLPDKVFLLRGNHETRDVNGWEEHYAERSFLNQARTRFGDDIGYRLWEICNQAFDRLPLCAVIDQDIFCVHGGIPRPISPNTTRIQDILTVPKVAGINPPYEHEDEKYQQVASDCIWSDPASEEQELTTVDHATGYGESLRGGGAICFGNRAVTHFLNQHDFSYIMRAHEAHAEGVAVSKEARVFTVFSTSQDHNQGSQAMAGCILVDNEKLQVINRSPAYKNKYIHRRDSTSLVNVSEAEIQKRIKLGLVQDDGQQITSSPEIEHWEDFASDDEDDDVKPTTVVDVDVEEEYIFDQGRRSSVDLSSMTENSHDEAVKTEWENENSSTSVIHEYEPNKRPRSKKPSFTPIDEERSEDVEGDNEMDGMERESR